MTKEGKLFFQGWSKKYMLGDNVGNSEKLNQFYEVRADLFPRDQSDKITDVSLGKHFIMIVTESGKVYGSGYVFHRYLSKCRVGRNEDSPY